MYKYLTTRIISWNIDGLKNKNLLFYQEILQLDPDYFFFCETWCSEEEASTVFNFLPNYSFIAVSACSPTGRGRKKGGLLFGYKDYFHPDKIFKNDFLIHVKINDVSIICVYTAPNEQGGVHFQELCSNIINNEESKVIVIGDINARVGEIPNINPHTGEKEYRISEDKLINSRGKELMKFGKENGFYLLNGVGLEASSKYTFISKIGCSTPDLCLVSSDILNYNPVFEVLNSSLSTHFPIQLQIFESSNCSQKSPNFPVSHHKSTNIPVNYHASHVNHYNLLGKTKHPPHPLPIKILWDNDALDEFHKNLPNLNGTTSYNELKNGIFQALEKTNKCRKPRPPNFKPQPLHPSWFDSNCKKLKKETKLSLKQLRKANQEDFTPLKDKYLNSRVEYLKKLKETKQQHNEKILTTLLNHKKPIEFWDAVKKLNSKSFLKNEINPDSWVQHYQKLFCSNTSTSPTTPLTLETNNELDHEITLPEIRNTIKKLKNKKAPGHDGIPNEIWKTLNTEYIEKLCSLFNKILNDGNIPEDWTTVLLQPIFKKGDKNDPQNYRPIALAPTILKVFTTIITKRLNDWAVNNGKISEYQAGFKKGIGTMEHLFCLLTLIQSRLRLPKKRLYVAYVDLKSAFDSPEHKKLWNVLKISGLGSKIVNVLMSLYSQAKGQVKLQTGLTEKFKMCKGIFQGDPCSGLIFNLFINDLTNELYNRGPPPVKLGTAFLHLLLFADDIVLFAETPQQLKQKIKIADSFFKNRGLTVNTSKTKVMVFSKRKSNKFNKTLAFKWGDEELEIVNSYKYLGVTFTSNCSFGLHMKETQIKVAAALTKVWTICKKGQVPPITTHIKLFNALVKSTLLYAAPIWAWGLEEELEKSQLSFLRRLFRLIPSAPGYFVRKEADLPQLKLQLLKSTLAFWIRTTKRDVTSLPFICLLEQLRWKEQAIGSAKFNWSFKIQQIIDKYCNLSKTNLMSPAEITSVRNYIISQYATFLENEDNLRIRNSTFIPLYQQIKTNSERENYCTLNLPSQIVQLFAQMRLNKFSIKIGQQIIKLNSRCPLCTCYLPNSTEHYLFQCHALNSERSSLIQIYGPFNCDNIKENLVNFLTLNPNDKKFYENVFLFWCKVAKYFDLCE